jgi:L-amino acid N-acyltransferase YncA
MISISAHVSVLVSAVPGWSWPGGAARPRVLPGERRLRRVLPDIVMGRPVPAAPADQAPLRRTAMPQDQPPDALAMTRRAAVTVPEGVVIRPMEAGDAGQVLAVYQAGLDTGQASFETTAPAWEAFDAAKLPGHRFTAAGASGQVLGWVAAFPVSARHVYAGVIEHSVYVRPGYHRRGIGAALLRALIGSAEAAGIWTIQSSIFPENTASLRMHQQAGFRVVGTRERIARHHGQWRDTVLIERRSAADGTV